MTDTIIKFDIPRQRADLALTEFAEQADLTLVFPDKLVREKTANRLVGRYSREEAIHRLLQGTGLKPMFRQQLVLSIEADETSLTEGEAMRDKQIRKKTKKRLLAGIAAFFTSVVAIPNVSGQETERDSANSLIEEIIVTAQKREQSLLDVPISLTVLGGQEIQDRGLADFEDLGFAVPGLTVQESGDLRQIAIRGVQNISGPTPLTGVYIDELPANAGQVGNGFDLPDLRLYDLERVEVLKGPQGTLFGQGSVGGTVRFITKKPDLNEVQAKVSAEMATTKDGAPSQTIQGVLNVPLVEDELAIRISPTWDHQGGWIDQPGALAKDVNDSSVINVRLNTLWQPSDSLSVSGMVIVHRNDAGGPNRGEDEDGNYNPALFGLGVNVEPERTEDYELYNLTLDYDLGGVTLVSSSSYTDRYVKSMPFYDPIYVVLDYPVQSQVFSQEVRFSSDTEGPLEWVIGGVYNDVDSVIGADVFFLPLGGPVDLTAPRSPDFTFIQRHTSKSWAVFGDANYRVSDRFRIGVGLRYFEDDRTFFDGVQNEESFDVLTPRFYANYDLTDDLTAYVNIAKGFRSGGFNAAGGAPYDPETVWTYDVGVRGSLLDGRLFVDVSGYYSDYQNYLANTNVPGQLLSTFNNLASVEIIGGEVAVSWSVSDSLALGFSASYTDAEIASTGGGTGGAFLAGDDINGIAPFSFTASAEQQFTVAGHDGALRLDYSHQDRIQEIARNFGTFVQSDLIDLLNADVSFRLSDKFTLGVFARNILNDRGITYVVNGVQGRGIYSPRSRPRTFGIRLSYEL